MKISETKRSLENAARLLSEDRPDLNAVMIEINTALGLIQNLKPVRVIIEVRGGVVNAIHSSSEINSSILDWDNVHMGNEEERETAQKLDAETADLSFAS